MKHKTSELTGPALDWAVAICEAQRVGATLKNQAFLDGLEIGQFAYSTDWAIGGPIIERERIELLYFGTYGAEGAPWEAQIGVDSHYIDQGCCEAMGGATPLMTAMRAYVQSKLGDTVELPI